MTELWLHSNLSELEGPADTHDNLAEARPRMPYSDSMNYAAHSNSIFDTYWRFAAERQQVYLRRLCAMKPPWTDDPVINSFRFTNPYRVTDRVSQYLIKHVIYDGDQNPGDILLRILIFKWFNRISTWELLLDRLGPLTLANFDPSLTDKVLSAAMRRRERIYSAAYIVPPVPGTTGAKHTGHLNLTVDMYNDGIIRENYLRPYT